MNTRLLYGFIALMLMGCERKPFKVVPQQNPAYVANSAFLSSEDLSSPKFQALKDKYQTDTIFHGEENEFKRILLLRNWVSHIIRISDFEEEYPGDGYAEGILDAAIKGHGFHCGHYMIVQNAVMNSYGYITRCLGSGPGVKGGPDWHHGMNEIWSNTYHKWFLSDAKYNHHFEKDGIPLSALEVRDAYLKNEAADIKLVKGPERIEIAYDSLKNVKGQFYKKYRKDFAQAYTWIEWERLNNRFTGWPRNSHELNKYNMYADDYFNSHTWIWDGKPHWAYHTEFMIPVKERKAFEWTPNTIEAKADIHSDTALIRLSSATPNFKTYQIKRQPAGEWENVADSLSIVLNKDSNTLAFRSVNLAGVTGPEAKVMIAR